VEYLGYLISGSIAILVGFLQSGNNRRYHEFQDLKKFVNTLETQVAVNTNSDKKDSQAFDKHEAAMDKKFDELNKIIGDFTSNVESEIKEIKDTVTGLKVSIAELKK